MSCVDTKRHEVKYTHMRFALTFLICILGFNPAAMAEAIDYDIVTGKSLVGFTYQFGANEVLGKFTNYSADISIDFEKANNSQVDVVLNTATATGGFAFATQALRSKKVLDSGSYPNIKFVSKSVKPDGTGAIIDGLVTVRGITKPLTLKAQLSRSAGTLSSERENLRITLSGAINRHDFGASGYPNDVGDMLKIKIDARIKRK